MNEPDPAAGKSSDMAADPLSDVRQVLAEWAARDRLIACDLHDQLIQLLVGAKMQLESVAPERDIPGEGTRKRIAAASENIGAALQEAIQLMQQLASTRIEEGELPEKIQSLVGLYQESGLELTCRFAAGLESADPLVAGNLYRVVQEGLRNVAKHASASRAFVSVDQVGEQWVLVLLDNGRGVESLQPASGGFGISGIRSRARILGGNAQIDSSRIDPARFGQLVSSLLHAGKDLPDPREFQSGTLIRVDFPT